MIAWMNRNHRTVCTALLPAIAIFAGLWAPRAGLAADDNFPQRPIEIIVPYGAGNSIDSMARIVGERLSAIVKQPVVIQNKPGGGTIIGTSFVVRAPADGYTLLAAASTLTAQQAVNKNFTINIERDLIPVTESMEGNYVVVGAPNAPFKTFAEMVAYSKAHPNELKYGSDAIGGATHMNFEYIKSVTGAKLQHVPFNSASSAVTATAQGIIQVFLNPVSTIKPLVDDGKLNGLAITGAKRSKLLPNVPTIAESGTPGFDVAWWQGFFAPAGTPQPVVDKLNASIREALRDPGVMSRIDAIGGTPIGNSQQEFVARVRDETGRWNKLANEQNLKIE